MVYLICYGLVSCILIYCLMDGLRFIDGCKDKTMYVISCLLQKPILIPLLAPGACFTSPIANRKFGNQVRFMVDGMEQTHFMLAVQETNFLYSFTLATLSTCVTIFVIITEGVFDATDIVLMGVGIAYMIYGFIVSVCLYGRKTHHDAKMMQAKESFWVQRERPNGLDSQIESGNYLAKA